MHTFIHSETIFLAPTLTDMMHQNSSSCGRDWYPSICTAQTRWAN